jgi:predicted AAA+ superfamily ATPase
VFEYQRSQVDTLAQRLAEPVARIQVVSGPRQTGKTTIAAQALSRAGKVEDSSSFAIDAPEGTKSPLLPSHFLDNLPPQRSVRNPQPGESADRAWLADTWEKARFDAWRSKAGHVLVLDEIQKIGGWSDTVMGLWEQDRRQGCPLHVVLLGSAPLLMRRGLSESLAGRFELIRVSHWTLGEMQEAFGFDLDQYIYFGGYPGPAQQRLIDDEPRWRSYVRDGLIEPHIERDVLAMADVRKPALLKRAFELGSSYSGQILSYNKMLGQLQDAKNTTTLAHYLELLSAAGLLAGLSSYAGHEHRRRKSSPKLNVLNTALMTAISGYSFAEARADRTFWGRLTETAVGAHLFNTGWPEIEVHYWRRDNRGSSPEVDFVLRRGRRLLGIEVKSASGSNADGRAAFEKETSQPTLLVGGDGIPLEVFLSEPAEHWLEEAS